MLGHHFRTPLSISISLAVAALAVTFLARPTVAQSPTPDVLPPAKQAILAKQDAAISVGQSLAASRPKSADTATPVPADPGSYVAPHFAIGSGNVVATTDPPPGDNGEIAVVTEWVRDPASPTVFTGSDPTDPSAGVVLAQTGEHGQPLRLVVPGHGALTIIGGSDTSLQLLAADGTTMTYDVTSATIP